jgi:hypothetical protein
VTVPNPLATAVDNLASGKPAAIELPVNFGVAIAGSYPSTGFRCLANDGDAAELLANEIKCRCLQLCSPMEHLYMMGSPVHFRVLGSSKTTAAQVQRNKLRNPLILAIASFLSGNSSVFWYCFAEVNFAGIGMLPDTRIRAAYTSPLMRTIGS